MAFGMSLGGDSGKLVLTLFRIIAAVAIGYYLIRVVNQKAHPGFRRNHADPWAIVHRPADRYRAPLHWCDTDAARLLH